MDFTEKTISKEVIFEGNVINLSVDTVLLPNGNTSTRELILHPGGVGILPIDNDNNVYLVRQFRKPYEKPLLEIPAGKKTPGEEPILCGKRELLEETGFVAQNFIDIGTVIPTPGYTNEIINLYIAKGLTYECQQPDEDEFLNVEKYKFEDVYKMCITGEISDAKTLIAIMKAKDVLSL